MTDRELMQMALNDLEALVAYIKGSEPDLVMQVPSIELLRAALAQPQKDLELPLVQAEEFVKLIEGKENFRGIPVMRTEWPTMEEA